jgi:AcrR family transcriptional regulator
MSKELRRQQLLEAARTVFAEKGFHEAKVRDIAAAAHVAKGTVYLYFEDKRSILVELIDTLFVRIATAILRVDTDADVASQVKHNIRAILSVLVDDSETLRILFTFASSVDPSVSKKIDTFYNGLKDLLTESLQDGQELGIVIPGDARLYASFTLGALKELMVEATTRPVEGKPTDGTGPRSREQIVDGLFDLLQRGYLRLDAAEEKPQNAQ